MGTEAGFCFSCFSGPLKKGAWHEFHRRGQTDASFLNAETRRQECWFYRKNATGCGVCGRRARSGPGADAQ